MPATDALPLAPEPVPLERWPDGSIRLRGSRTAFYLIVESFDRGATPDQLAEQYDARTLADVYSLVAYRLRHPEAVARYLAEVEPGRPSCGGRSEPSAGRSRPARSGWPNSPPNLGRRPWYNRANLWRASHVAGSSGRRPAGQLNGLNAVVPVCEPTGEMVGQFVPQDQYLAFVYARVRDVASTAELEAAAATQGGRRLADIKRDRMGGA